MHEQFGDLGRDMFLTGLVSSHTGSMSLRGDGDQVVISRRGAMLAHLSEEDLVQFAVDDAAPATAAEEALIHQGVYRATDARAVIYARPPATMALALVEDRLAPANGEGLDALGTVPVLLSQRALDSEEVASLVARSLKESRIVALRGHGVFARGDDLADALRVVSLLEETCKVVHIFRTLSREEQQPVGREWRDRPATGFRPGRGGEGNHRQGGPRPAQPRDGGGPRRTDAPRRPGGDFRGRGGPRRGAPPHR